MIKYHNIISLIIGLGFFLILQNFSIFRFLLPAFLIYTLLVAWYNKWYLTQSQKYNFWMILRPFLLLWSGFGIFLILPSVGLRNVFIIVSIVVVMFFELMVGNAAENLLLNETLVISLGFYIAFGAFDQYFLKIENLNLPLHLHLQNIPLQPFYALGIMLSTFLLARSFYEFIPKSNHSKNLAALILSLLCVELFWALSFLPFHYPFLAIILFNLFYFCLIMNHYHFFNTLNLKKIQFHLVLIIIITGLVALSTPWKILE